MAEKLRRPIVIVNEGETRADDMATLKVEQSAANRLQSSIKLFLLKRANPREHHYFTVQTRSETA